MRKLKLLQTLAAMTSILAASPIMSAAERQTKAGPTSAPEKSNVMGLSTPETIALFSERFGREAHQIKQSEFSAFVNQHGIVLPHPLCLDAAAPPLASSDDECAHEITDSSLEVSMRGGLPYLFAELPKNGEWNMRAAFSAYTLAGVFNGQLLLETVWSGGGSGTWLNAVTFNPSDEKSVFMDGGDRCNGGVTHISLSPEGILRIETSLTPYDLLNYFRESHQASEVRSEHMANLLELEGERAQEGFNGWKAYDDVEACAVCCAGVARTNFDLVRLGGVDSTSEVVRFNSKYFEKFRAPQQDVRSGDRAITLVLLGSDETEAPHALADRYLSSEEHAEILGLIKQAVAP
jgi:hypothetical protein